MECPFKVVSVSGDARECGRQHGAQARELVQRNVEYYLGYWSRNLGMTRSDVSSYGDGMLSAIRGFDEDVHREVLGVAEGSGVDPRLVAAMNARYELAWASPSQLMDGCTCISATPKATEDGGTLLAQNWDYRLEHDRQEETICSVVFSPEERLFLLTGSPPCKAEYHELRLDTLRGSTS